MRCCCWRPSWRRRADGLLTLDAFERRLRRALVERVARIRMKASWRQAAGIEWDEGDQRIGTLWIEPFQRGIGWAVVHELTHYVHRERYEGEGELEEAQVEGLATEIWRRIEASRSRYWWWRRRVFERLVRGDL